MRVQKPIRRLPLWLKIVRGICLVVLFALCLCVAIIIFWPEVAAQNIDRLRDVIGDAPVAQLETAMLSVQDWVQNVEYQLGLRKPAAPWGGSPANPVATQSAPPLKPGIGATATPANLHVWQPEPLTPFGKLTGEGQWLPYLRAADGRTTVAYRTFLEPDPRRPYSVIALVAFDLQATRLHFVLGAVEPIPAKPQPSRTGTIPASDLQPSTLLATFNGGFKARHGHFGAMADGLVALPPINGLATIAVFADGHLQMGEWGTDIMASSDLVAWRQNGKLLIHRSQITPETAQVNELWGSTIQGDSITWRSALGLSADGRTLYYAAGEQTDVVNLAKAMARAGTGEALELDVNNYWVHFAAILWTGTTLNAEPLLDGMNQDVGRYLKSSARDFFYVSTTPPDSPRVCPADFPNC